MDGGSIIEPTPLCQEALWRAMHAVIGAVQHIGDPWFPGALVFTASGGSVVVKDAGGEGVVEVQKGRVTVLTRPCIAVITRSEVELYQCTTARYAKGRWLYFSKYVVPYAEKEYYEAGEIYEALAQAFRRTANLILDMTSP